MRPKPRFIVLTRRPELRFVLRIEGGAIVCPAETMPEFMKRLVAAEPGQIVIIDQRDSPVTARRAAQYLRRYPGLFRTIVITGSQTVSGVPFCDEIIRDGVGLYDRLFNSLKIIQSHRRRGPNVLAIKESYASFREAVGS